MRSRRGIIEPFFCTSQYELKQLGTAEAILVPAEAIFFVTDNYELQYVVNMSNLSSIGLNCSWQDSDALWGQDLAVDSTKRPLAPYGDVLLRGVRSTPRVFCEKGEGGGKRRSKKGKEIVIF